MPVYRLGCSLFAANPAEWAIVRLGLARLCAGIGFHCLPRGPAGQFDSFSKWQTVALASSTAEIVCVYSTLAGL